MSAVEPLVELFLELGITSPEAESLLRSVFVHKARDWLAKSAATPADPSDVRVSLVTGVHRNFVRKILAEPPGISAAREQKGHPAGRVLEAWHSDPKYLDSSGKPRDLSEREQEPSFHSLVLEHLPGGVYRDHLGVRQLPGQRKGTGTGARAQVDDARPGGGQRADPGDHVAVVLVQNVGVEVEHFGQMRMCHASTVPVPCV